MLGVNPNAHNVPRQLGVGILMSIQARKKYNPYEAFWGKYESS